MAQKSFSVFAKSLKSLMLTCIAYKLCCIMKQASNAMAFLLTS